MDHGIGVWAGLVAFVLVAFIVDFKFFEPKDGSRASFKRAGWWSLFWLLLAFAFGGVVFATGTTEDGSQFLTGYLLERSLSLDNVFVFALIFGAMAVPEEHRQRVLEFGIMAALVLRFGFILLGAALVKQFDWVLIIFGAFLLYTGVQMMRHRDEEEDVDPDSNIGVKIVKRFFPVTDDYRGPKLFVKENGKRLATPLFAVMMAVATADVIFAVDSIPAIFGITTDTFIVFSANAFALLGMRALYALLENAADRFVYLKIGLAFILVFIGLKMIIEHWIHIPVGLSLAVIILTIIASIVLSLRKTSGDGSGGGGGSATPATGI